MINPRYLVNITNVPSRPNGQTLSNIGGVTYSVNTYSTPLFVATMPEIKISATGSTYEESLDNLLIIAATYSGQTPPPLSDTDMY